MEPGQRSVWRVHLVLLCTVMLAGTVASAQEPAFCWKDSYGRGVGSTPSSCAPGQDMLGLLCYDKCAPGMARFGVDCHSTCPAGMDSQGLFCRRSEYGRGAGFPWQPLDGLSDGGMQQRCERVHGSGNCEKNGAIFYPKCRPGYKAFGCCLCRPEVPNCQALGLNAGIDLSCAKRVQVGSPTTGICGPGQEKDGGLCYSRCNGGYEGVGPVCWADKPAGWVNCGMGAAKDDATCAQIVFDQVSSVGQLAMFVASLGSSSAGSAATGGARSASRVAELRRQFEAMKRTWDQVRNTPQIQRAIQAAEGAALIKQGYDISQEAQNAVTEEDMARVAAQIAAIVDPTGVAGTVAAYTYAKCSRYFGGATPPPVRPVPSPPPPSGVSEWVACANEGGVCSFAGTREVRYGAGDRYTVATATNGVRCVNEVFGDPIVGVVKQCFLRASAPPPRTLSCSESVQGRIAWNYSGNTNWVPANLVRLCRGAAHAEPARCFERVMHGGVSWGGGTQWSWENAIDLCEGSQNAERTVSCFQSQMAQGRPWSQAIAACDERRP